jgi:hypothetical protein
MFYLKLVIANNHGKNQTVYQTHLVLHEIKNFGYK